MKIAALLRIKHWTKNLLVFVPQLFAGAFETEAVILTIIAFFAMCLMSSAVYVINDIHDRETDAHNPAKRLRPIAAGTVSPRAGMAAAVLCCLLSLSSCFILGTGPLLVLAVYLGLNLLYSFCLRQKPVIDAMCVAIGFVLRLMLCGAAININITAWLIILIFFASLYMAFDKRRCEMRLQLAKKRQSLSHYTIEQLERFTNISATVTLAAYAVFTLDPDTIAKFKAPHLYFTTLIAVYIIFAYSAMTDKSPDGDPVSELFRHPSLLFVLLFWLAACSAIIYLHL